jgi:hypothetical protein
VARKQDFVSDLSRVFMQDVGWKQTDKTCASARDSQSPIESFGHWHSLGGRMPRKTTRDVSEPGRGVRHSDTCISPSVRIALLINCLG